MTKEGIVIPISEIAIGNRIALACDARSIFEYFNSHEVYSTWIKIRISRFNLIENNDYIKTTDFAKDKQGLKKTNCKKRHVYHITLDATKKITMLASNEQKKRILYEYLTEISKNYIEKVIDPNKEMITKLPEVNYMELSSSFTCPAYKKFLKYIDSIRLVRKRYQGISM